MNRLALATLPLLFATFASADIRPLPALAPADLTVTYRRGPVAAGEGTAEFIELRPLDRGKHTYTVTRGTIDWRNQRTITKRRVIGAATANQFYTVVANTQFFALDATYTNPDVHDGASQSLAISAGARANAVVVSNTSVRAFTTVTTALRAL